MSFKNIIIICLFLGFSITNTVKALNSFTGGITENLYLFENNKDYLIINGVKRKISFNPLDTWKASTSNIILAKRSLRSFKKLKEIMKGKTFKLMIYGYYSEYGRVEYQISSWAFIPLYNLFNYFDLKRVILDKYNSKYGFKIKGSDLIYNDYVYNYLDHTGDNQYLYINDNEYMMYFDKENSNKKALISYYALKWEILYAIEKDIRIIGYYDKASKMFILKHWYLEPPFKYVAHNKDHSYRKVVKRWKLKKSYFKKDTYFGKANIDKPEIYHSSKHFYKNNKVIYLNKRKK